MSFHSREDKLHVMTSQLIIIIKILIFGLCDVMTTITNEEINFEEARKSQIPPRQ